MECYFCKKEISTATRCYVPARDNREKDKFRDLCRPCYLTFMANQGYVFDGIMWKKEG